MNEYDKLLKPVRRHFKFSMLNFLDGNWTVGIWSTTSLLMVLLLNVGPFLFILKNAGDIENIQDVAEAGGTFGSVFAMFAKILILLWKREEILSFSNNIKRQYSESLNEHPDITNGYASCLSLIVKTVAVFLTILTSLYAMSTLYGEARLPILMEIPYLPADGWPFFHINYGIELVLMWLGSNIAAGTELFTFFFIHFVRCRIEILVRMVEQWNNNINYNRHRDINVRQNGLLLEEIVRYHSSVKQNMAAIQRIFSPMLMATLLSSTIVICMCLIIITINPLLKIFPHIVLALGQNFMYCFVGNLLILQSDKLYEQIILVDFYYLNVSERKSYLNVVRNAGYPIKLRSYFVTVDMALFFKVVKFAYSVFSLMETRM